MQYIVRSDHVLEVLGASQLISNNLVTRFEKEIGRLPDLGQVANDVILEYQISRMEHLAALPDPEQHATIDAVAYYAWWYCSRIAAGGV